MVIYFLFYLLFSLSLYLFAENYTQKESCIMHEFAYIIINFKRLQTQVVKMIYRYISEVLRPQNANGYLLSIGRSLGISVMMGSKVEFWCVICSLVNISRTPRWASGCCPISKLPEALARDTGGTFEGHWTKTDDKDG